MAQGFDPETMGGTGGESNSAQPQTLRNLNVLLLEIASEETPLTYLDPTDDTRFVIDPPKASEENVKDIQQAISITQINPGGGQIRYIISHNFLDKPYISRGDAESDDNGEPKWVEAEASITDREVKALTDRLKTAELLATQETMQALKVLAQEKSEGGEESAYHVSKTLICPPEKEGTISVSAPKKGEEQGLTYITQLVSNTADSAQITKKFWVKEVSPDCFEMGETVTQEHDEAQNQPSTNGAGGNGDSKQSPVTEQRANELLDLLEKSTPVAK
ncbi:hypothetical protein A3F37_03405 [Candidatus Saccharibacteria bacterium RIFCSPHIGHO2_12_FULL_41_12]|nr:MAG: hypothetical protein A3F37_03405 [Candidatus Saccharibacteria bacterium RIFCSPHIGHO2_12_FULL_41_12]